VTKVLVNHHIHGKDRHDLCIYLCERMLRKAGHLLMDGSWCLKKGYMSGEPDIYVRMYDQRKDAYGTTTPTFQDYIIEVESKLSKANRLKKYAQFKETVKGIELIIINLADAPCHPHDFVGMEIFMGQYLPCVKKPKVTDLMDASKSAGLSDEDLIAYYTDLFPSCLAPEAQPA